MRLDRLLANLGYGSRREVAGFLRAGRLTRADGRVVGEADRVAHGDLRFDGEPLDPPAPLTLILHKPIGYTCSREDPGDLVFDLLPARYPLRNPPLSTVGRLDKDTSGLLLLTDDGTLLHRIISPKKEVWKTYEAELARPLTGNEAALFAAGDLLLNGEKSPCRPARLEVLEPQRARLSISEGRYHQVRRMFAAAGNHVETLWRVSLGRLTLADLSSGQWRTATEEDLRLLLAGGSDRIPG